MIRHLIVRVMTGLALLVCLPASASWALMVRLSPREKAEQADCIVAGQVEKIESHLDPIAHIPYTEVTFVVTDIAKAQPQPLAPTAKLVIRVPGGRVGNMGMIISDLPRFSPGEQVVLFLKPVSPRTRAYQVVNGSFGKYRVVRDVASQQEVVLDAEGQPMSVEERRALGLDPSTSVPVTRQSFIRSWKALIDQQRRP